MDKTNLIVIKLISFIVLIFIVTYAVRITPNNKYKTSIIAITFFILLSCIILCSKQIKKYLNANKEHFWVSNNAKTPWMCENNLTSPIRINANGDPECMSTNGRDCWWTNNNNECLAAIAQPPRPIIPLACGDMHNRVWGGTGYDNPNHWCYKSIRGLRPTNDTDNSPFLLGIGTNYTVWLKRNIYSNWEYTGNNSCCVTGVFQMKDGRLLGIGTNNSLYVKNRLGGPWYHDGKTPANAIRSITQVGDTLIGVNMNYKLIKKDNLSDANWTEIPNSGDVSFVSTMNDGSLLGVGKDNYLVYTRSVVMSGNKFASLGNSWDPRNSCCVKSIVQMDDGSFIGVGTDNQLWSKKDLSSSWIGAYRASCCILSICKYNPNVYVKYAERQDTQSVDTTNLKLIYNVQNPTFGPLNGFPMNKMKKKWQLQIKFRLNKWSQNRWQSIIGNMYNNQVSGNRGWGIWVNPSKVLHWSWSTATINLEEIGEVDEDVNYTLVVTFENNKYNFKLYGAVFETVYSKGNYGNFDAGKIETDEMFRKSKVNGKMGVFRRDCINCYDYHKRLYYKRIGSIPNNFSIYDQFNNWTSNNNVLNQNFKLFNNGTDLDNDTNGAKFCNYDDPNIGFPRDCGKDGPVGWQWNSLIRGGQEHVRYSIPIEQVREQTVENGGNTITIDRGICTVGGQWENYKEGEKFQGIISNVQFYSFYDEAIDSAKCNWTNGDYCIFKDYSPSGNACKGPAGNPDYSISGLQSYSEEQLKSWLTELYNRDSGNDKSKSERINVYDYFLRCKDKPGYEFLKTLNLNDPRKVNCEVEWSEGECSKECGGGKKVIKGTVKKQPEYGGTPCPSLTREVDCNTEPCWETRPTPPCGKGWFEQTENVIKVCPNNSQLRNGDGMCLCTGPNDKCATEFGYSCVNGVCKRTYDDAAKNETRCNV